jgi:hypothetical protein
MMSASRTELGRATPLRVNDRASPDQECPRSGRATTSSSIELPSAFEIAPALSERAPSRGGNSF